MVSTTVVSICQIVSAIVMISLLSTSFGSSNWGKKNKSGTIGPLIIGLVIIGDGILGVLVKSCGNVTMVMHAIGAAVSSCGSLVIVWIVSSEIHQCSKVFGTSVIINCSNDSYTRAINIAVLVAAIICSIISTIGMFSTAFTICRRLPENAPGQ